MLFLASTDKLTHHGVEDFAFEYSSRGHGRRNARLGLHSTCTARDREWYISGAASSNALTGTLDRSFPVHRLASSRNIHDGATSNYAGSCRRERQRVQTESSGQSFV